MIRRRKKSTKKRGRESHSGLRRRGAGNRGGRGMAGMGKKTGSQKKTRNLAKKIKLGHQGFTNPTRKKQKIINVRDLEKHAVKSEVNTKKLGYDKVGGKGELKANLKVIAKSFTKKAETKIKKAKGQAVVI